MTELDKRIARAKRYLAKRGISAIAPDSKLIYRDSAGKETQPPAWIKHTEPLVIVPGKREAK